MVKKNPVNGTCVGGSALLMKMIGGKWPDQFSGNRKATVAEIIILYNGDVQKLISKHISRSSRWAPLLLESKKLKLQFTVDQENAFQSDESLILLWHSDGVASFRCKQYESMHISCLVSNVQTQCGGYNSDVMIWGIFS